MTHSVEGPCLGKASLCEPIMRSLPDWFGIEDDNGPIPCTRENKIKLMSESAYFASFVGDGIDKLTRGLAGDAERLEKN